MAVVSIATLKTYFETGDFPTESQFVDLIDTLSTASTVSLSSITAAGVTNSINNLNYAQVWAWNTLASSSALKLSTTSTLAALGAQIMLDIALSGANANAGQHTYGLFISNAHTGATSSNRGIYVNTSGGTRNYAIETGEGNIGFGTTPDDNTRLHLRAQDALATSYAVKVHDVSSVNLFTIRNDGEISLLKSINTTAGDSATINTTVGRFRKDTSGTTFTLTNSFITANSIIHLTYASDPGITGFDAIVVAGAGSAVITFFTSGVAAAPTANTDINFIVIN